MRFKQVFIAFLGISLISGGLWARSIEGRGIKALDGDSILVKVAHQGVFNVRLLGIDAPEYSQPFGERAKIFLNRRIQAKKILLKTDLREKDKYDRLLAYVFVNDRFVNSDLVREGLALVYVLPPNLKYLDDLLWAQKEAYQHKRGIWSKEGKIFTPRSYRHRDQHPPRLLFYHHWILVGNRRSRVVHLPGCHHIEKIKPRNKVYFTALKEALQKGFHLEKGYKSLP